MTRGRGRVLDRGKVSYVDAVIGATKKWELRGHPSWGSILTFCQPHKRKFYSVEEYRSARGHPRQWHPPESYSIRIKNKKIICKLEIKTLDPSLRYLAL